MYLDFLVSIPSTHIVRITRDGVKYIYYEYDRKYDGKKGYNSAKRACIGKQSEEDCNKMYPNQNYLKHFPGVELPTEKSPFLRSSALKVGMYILIDHIATSMGIKEILNTILGEDDGGLFLDFAAYTIVTEGNAAQYYPDYAFNHALFTKDMYLYSDSKLSEFLHEMREDAPTLFLNDWTRKNKGNDKIYISYDSTNKNSQAGELEILEYGKAKDDKGLPIFGYSIAYDRTNSIPLFYEEYPGSIVDISQLEFMLEKASSYGYRNATFILDRGYFSKSNLRLLEKKHYGYIIMLKGMNSLVEEVVTEKRNSFENDRDCYVRKYGVYGTTVERKLYTDNTKEKHIHLFHSNERRAAETWNLEKKLNQMMDTMDKHKNTRFDFEGAYRYYFNLTYDEDGVFLMYSEKKHVIEEELSYCGYFCIVTSEKMSASEALEIYKSRDENEKLFRGDKSYLGDKSMRVYSTESTSSKIFIEFVALIIRSKIYTYLRDAMKKIKSKPNYGTVPACVRELEKIEMVRHFDGVYRIDHAVTKHQRDILSFFGLDGDMVLRRATEIGKVLTIQKKGVKD